MTTPKSDDLLTEAHQAYQDGDRARMRDLLKQAAAQDPNNFQVWLLATYATDDKAQQRQFINRAKQLKRANSRILMRERNCFPRSITAFRLRRRLRQRCQRFLLSQRTQPR